MPAIFWLVPFSSILALAFAYYFFKQMMRADEGTDMMKKIAEHVRKGAGLIYVSNTRLLRSYSVS
jgi:K(+)-stimulated pyrophosphate-energized sodium pump